MHVGSRTIAQDAWRRKKAAALVKLLALAPDHSLHREQIMDLLWSDLGKKAASNNLRQTLYATRRILAYDQSARSRFLGSDVDSLVLCPKDDLWVDVDAFEAAALSAQRSREPDAYEAAIELYVGELLPEDRYEEWAIERRRELGETHASLVLGLASVHEERENYGSAIEVLRKMTREELTNEEAQAGLMRLYALSGRKADALRHYEFFEEIVSRDLGTGPGASTRALKEEIASGRFPPEAARPLALSSKEASETPRHKLPVPRTSFVGRGRELGEVKQALAMTRLLTLTGTGGSGKTRLALRVASDLASVYPDGVRFVELAGLSEPELVPQQVADAVGVREEPGRPLVEVIAQSVREKALLLVLDNCEHLVDAAARLSDFLLASCSRLKVMATSREPLGVEGEVLFPVQPLPVPSGLPTDPTTIVDNDSVRLFVERTRLKVPGFSLTRENVRPVFEVCRRLEGLPLGIELAAARMGTLATDLVAKRLEGSLGLLSAGPRTASARQRTMRATIGWSYGLLSEPEKETVGRLSVFSGGFTLEAAQAVCPGGIVEEGEVLNLVSSLVDKSLVVAETDAEGRVRYRMLEPIRQYARERLQERGNEDAVRLRHAEFFLTLAESAEPELKGAAQEEWLERLEVEHDNLRAALGWTLGSGEGELGLRLSAALAEFWHLHVYHDEAGRWLEGALTMEGGDPPSRMKALERAAFLAWEQGDYGRTVALGEEGLALARRLGDGAVAAGTLLTLGSVAMSRVEFERASALLEEAVGLWRASVDDRGLARAHHMLGLVAVVERDHDRAEARYEESLALARRSADETGIMRALGVGALAAVVRGDSGEANALAKATMRSARRLGVGHYAVSCLAILAASTALRDRPVRAARLWGSEDALRVAMGIPRMPAEQVFYEPYVEAARDQLHEAAWETAWSEGRAMSMEDAIDYALSEDEQSFTKPRAPEEPPTDTVTANLARREREVATLVARGMTNRQIAMELSISEHTVANHVGRILRKLKLESRAQISAWVVERRTPS